MWTSTRSTNRRTCSHMLTGMCLVTLWTSLVGGSAAPAAPARSPGPAALLLGQAEETSLQAAPPPPDSSGEPGATPEQKRKARSAVLLLSVLAGIALSGLLLIIASIAVRGLQRRLAGPTQLDRAPQDLLPDVVAPAGDSSRRPGDGGAAADETQHT